MLTSLIIIAHNEGDRLWKTVRSCVENPPEGEHEIIVVDDASKDTSVAELWRRYPHVRMVQHEQRLGASQVRNTGASAANGDVLLFLDGHCHADPGALTRLVRDVEELGGDALVAPRIAVLDTKTWQNSTTTCGNGYQLDLQTQQERYIRLPMLRRRGRFYESPNMVGCCFAISRELFHATRGLDAALYPWGADTVEFGLRASLLGYRVVNDIEAVIGHRFQKDFEDFAVPEENILANRIRTARKHFCDAVWDDWLPQFQASKDASLWQRAWRVFSASRASAEQQRATLLATRRHHESWYAAEYDMFWPLSIASHARRSELIDAAIRRFAGSAPRDAVLGKAATWQESVQYYLQIGRRQWGDEDVEAVRFVATSEPLARAAAALAHRIDGRTLEYAQSLRSNEIMMFGEDLVHESCAQLALAALRDALRQHSQLSRGRHASKRTHDQAIRV